MKKIVLLFFVLFLVQITNAQEKHILTSDSVNLYIMVKGKGNPCLFLHGGPASGSFFLEKLAGDYLEQHFQMIYLDQRGSGRSTSPKDKNYSMDRMVNDFEEVRIALGIDKWITLGHSFGGLLQMGYIQKHPDVIEGMIMINCTLNIPESFNKSWFPEACGFLKLNDRRYYLDESVPIKDRLDSILKPLIQQDIIWKMSFSTKRDNEDMNVIFNDLPRGNDDFFNYGFIINDYLQNYQKETVKVNQPVLFFYGERDWCIGPEHYKGVHFPNMILWHFEGEHMMPFLKNKPDLEKAIDSYILKYKF
jgi:proline iminopeptidase